MEDSKNNNYYEKEDSTLTIRITNSPTQVIKNRIDKMCQTTVEIVLFSSIHPQRIYQLPNNLNDDGN